MWRQRVREYESSGMTAGAFARQRGFHQTTLSKYVRLFGRGVRTPTALALARVQPGTGTASMVPEVSERETLEIFVGRGVVVRVRRGFDGEVLSAVVRLLSSEP